MTFHVVSLSAAQRGLARSLGLFIPAARKKFACVPAMFGQLFSFNFHVVKGI